MTMVGKKKRNPPRQNHLITNNLNNEKIKQDNVLRDHQTRYNSNHPRRYISGVRNVGNNNETSVLTTFVRQRPFNVVVSGGYKKRQPPPVEDGILQRSDSREGGSASAGSLVSAAEDEGSPSASGIEGEADEPNGETFGRKSVQEPQFVEGATNLSQKEPVAEKGDTVVVPNCSTFNSVQSQTEFSSACTDIILAMSQLQPWERIETLSQLVYSISALEQRFLGSCVEAAVRSNSIHLRQYEMLYNDPQAIANCSTIDYHRLFDVAYAMICMLRAGSRQAATQFLEILNRLISGWATETSQWCQQEKEIALLKLKSIVSAAFSHPAVAVEDKVKLLEFHDQLRRYQFHIPISSRELSKNLDSTREKMSISQNLEGKLSKVQSCAPSTSNYVKPTVISSLDVVKVVQGSTSDEYAIEVSWSDGSKNYVSKTADQIYDMQARLLDEFPEEARSSSKSCRLIPYLCSTSPESVTNYIRSLPNLPARVLISPLIFDTFCVRNLDIENANDEILPTQSSLLADQSLSVKTENNIITSDTVEGVTSGFPQLCVLSHPYAPTVALCSPGNSMTTSSTACIPMPANALASPVTQYVSVLPRPAVPLRNVTPVVPRPVYAIQHQPNIPCQNCGGSHPFASCSQSTMLDAVNSGTYNLNFGIPDEPKLRASLANRNTVMPGQLGSAIRSVDINQVSANIKSGVLPEVVQRSRLNSTSKYPPNQLASEKDGIIVVSSAAEVSTRGLKLHVPVSSRNG